MTARFEGAVAGWRRAQTLDLGPRDPADEFGAVRIGLLGRLVGYGTVSAGTVVVTQGVLIVAYSVLSWPAVVANAVAVCVAAGPAYYANRRWVWARTDRHSVTREILPFWGYSLAGLGVSSLFVALAEGWWHSTVAVSAANLVGFGALWVGKFLLLDRVLFARSASHRVTGTPER